MADRDFKGIWIPREIWLDERLNATEKVILAEIDSLDSSDDGCWASNEYLAQFCQCSAWKVSSAVSKLAKLGYLKVVSFDGRRRKIKSCLTFFQMQTFENPKADAGISQEISTSKEYRNNNTPRSRAKTDISPGFSDFWAIYPRKVAKQSAIKAWNKTGADDSQSLTDTILADVNRRVSGEWRGKDMQYIPHPATYLNQRRWEDESTPGDTVERCEQDLSIEEVMRRGDDCSEPEGCKPCGSW